MSPDLISRAEFERRLGGAVAGDVIDVLFAHYRRLSNWNERLSLMAAGEAAGIVERHYFDSLEAVPMVPSWARVAVDVGSGGGFPGLVLAAALPDIEFTLVESRAKKWAFLKTTARILELDVRCVHGKIARALPDDLPQRIDLVTLRALRLSMPAWESLISRLSPDGHVLVWAGRAAPEVPDSLSLRDEHRVPGAEHRRILSYGRASS